MQRKGVHLTPEMWLAKLILGPIDSSWVSRSSLALFCRPRGRTRRMGTLLTMQDSQGEH